MPQLDLNTILIILGTFSAGVIAGLFLLKPKALNLEQAQQKAETLVDHATVGAAQSLEEAKEKARSLILRSHESEEKTKEQLKRIEHLIGSKEEQLQKRQQKNLEIKTILEHETKIIDEIKQKNNEGKKRYTENLAKQTGHSTSEIKEEVMQELQRDLDLMKEERLRKVEEYLNEDKVRIGKNMVVTAIQRYAAPTSVEKRDTTITVPRDEMKAKIIGQNGVNLILIEELTGVDIIFNDAPNTIIVSSFDLVRRHIARETINKLLKERIVTAEKIKQKIEEAKSETEKTLIKIGRDTIKQLELDNRKLPDEFAKIVGRLQFRTSYGQNILKHSLEVGHFTLILGNELGLNMETCKVGGFFHDLGKAIDQEVGGSHDALTKEIMEKFLFPEDEIHAAWAHHDAIPQRTAEAMLVKAGDAISAGRPGARQESIEKYIERIKAIEGISNSYEGVTKAFAISAGREVRVIVEPSVLNDDDLPDLAKNIAGEIQENVGYPGKIKINVIRRTQSFDHAKATAPAVLAGAPIAMRSNKNKNPKDGKQN